MWREWERAKVKKNVGITSEYSDVTLGGKVVFSRGPRGLRDEGRRNIPTSISCFVRMQKQSVAELTGVKSMSHLTVA